MTATASEQARRIAWWQEARFGMFIHWGLYSASRFGTWTQYDMGIPSAEYAERFEPEFTGARFDADALCALAKAAGCKYIVMGARHHEAYCLWDTGTTGFNSARMTPKCDFISEFVKAARKAGLRVGLYYSLCDWREQAYWDGHEKNPKAWRAFVDTVHAQVRELMSGYGKIDILWYDGAWAARQHLLGAEPGPSVEDLARAWRGRELNRMVRRLQPRILINDRACVPEDFTTPEQRIEPSSRPWELCDTLGELWGASSLDRNRKSALDLVTRLVACVSQGGNMLLNIGPRADGAVQPWQRRILEEIGGWMTRNGEAVYGCTGEWERPLHSILAPWWATRKGTALYLHLFRYPGESFSVGNWHGNRIVSAKLLNTGERLEVFHEATRDIIRGLPAKSPDPIAPVVKLSTRPPTDAERRRRRSIAH